MTLPEARFEGSRDMGARIAALQLSCLDGLAESSTDIVPVFNI
jgi:hypothetical protein